MGDITFEVSSGGRRQFGVELAISIRFMRGRVEGTRSSKWHGLLHFDNTCDVACSTPDPDRYSRFIRITCTVANSPSNSNGDRVDGFSCSVLFCKTVSTEAVTWSSQYRTCETVPSAAVGNGIGFSRSDLEL